MNWFNFFDTKSQALRHSFGRGINAKLSKDEELLFDQASEAFEKKDILSGYEYFLKSLENFTDDISNENVSLSRDGDTLHFEIFQGTARIEGNVTEKSLYAELIIAKHNSANVGLKRYILDRNYQLTYAYYFSDSDHIKLKIYHDNTTMNPQKIFFPLREIALNGDFDKEYIRNEFPDVALEDLSHLQEISTKELEIKYNFMQKTIQELHTKIETLPSNDNAGMQAFLLLKTLYMFDYLLVPKYNIYQKSSKKIQEYFAEESESIESKNNELYIYISQLQEMSFEEFCSNFYNAKYTFNPSDNSSKEEIDNFISESLLKVRWYKNNRYKQIIPTIYKYIVFHIFYNYGLNPVTKNLLHILIEIQNPNFFKSLEYTPLYDPEKNSFAKKSIISKIEEIIEPHQYRYKHLESFGEELNFDSLNEFSNSFYQQIQNLNFEEV